MTENNHAGLCLCDTCQLNGQRAVRPKDPTEDQVNMTENKPCCNSCECLCAELPHCKNPKCPTCHSPKTIEGASYTQCFKCKDVCVCPAEPKECEHSILYVGGLIGCVKCKKGDRELRKELIPTPPPQKDDWEEEFDEKCNTGFGRGGFVVGSQKEDTAELDFLKVKSFISSKRTQWQAEARREEREEILLAAKIISKEVHDKLLHLITPVKSEQ